MKILFFEGLGWREAMKGGDSGEKKHSESIGRGRIKMNNVFFPHSESA